MAHTTNVLVILLAVSATALAQAPVGSGTLSGTIVDEAGVPAARARLNYSKLTEYVRDQSARRVVKELGFSGAVIAGVDGRFSIPGLPAGRYSLCATGTGQNQVGSCDWTGAPVVLLGSGQKIDNLTRTIRKGTVLTLRVVDPSGRIVLPDSQGKVAPDRRFFIGLTSDSGFYRRAELVSKRAQEYVFQLTIPRGTSVRLFIDSDLTVTDASGAQLETKRPTTEQISPGGTDQFTFELRVS
jgi:hypothetical protein